MEFPELSDMQPWQRELPVQDRKLMINALLQIMMALGNRYPQARLLFLAQQYERVNFKRSTSRRQYLESINRKMADLRSLIREQGQPGNANPNMNASSSQMGQWSGNQTLNQMQGQMPGQIPGQMGQMPGQMGNQAMGQMGGQMANQMRNPMSGQNGSRPLSSQFNQSMQNNGMSLPNGPGQLDSSKIGLPNQQQGVNLSMGGQIPGPSMMSGSMQGNNMPGGQIVNGPMGGAQMNQMGKQQKPPGQVGSEQMTGQLGIQMAPGMSQQQARPTPVGGQSTAPTRIPVEDRDRIIRQIVPQGTKTPIPPPILALFPGLPPGTSSWEDVVRLTKGNMLSQQVHNQIKEKYQRYVNEALQLRYTEMLNATKRGQADQQQQQPGPASTVQKQQQQHQQADHAQTQMQYQAQPAKAQNRRQAEIRYRQQMLMQQEQQQQQQQQQSQQDLNKRMDANPADGMGGVNGIGAGSSDPSSQGIMADGTKGGLNAASNEALRHDGQLVRDMTSQEIMQAWMQMGFAQERAEVRQLFLEVKAELPRIQAEMLSKAPTLSDEDREFVSNQLVAPVFTKMISRTDQLIILYYLYSNKNRPATLKLIRIKPMLNFWHNQLAEYGLTLTSPEQLQTLKNELNRYFLFVSRCTKLAAEKHQQRIQIPPSEANTKAGTNSAQFQPNQTQPSDQQPKGSGRLNFPQAPPQRSQMTSPMMQVPNSGPNTAQPMANMMPQMPGGGANRSQGMMAPQGGPVKLEFPQGSGEGIAGGYGPGSAGSMKSMRPQSSQFHPQVPTQQQPRSAPMPYNIFPDASGPGVNNPAINIPGNTPNPAMASALGGSAITPQPVNQWPQQVPTPHPSQTHQSQRPAPTQQLPNLFPQNASQNPTHPMPPDAQALSQGVPGQPMMQPSLQSPNQTQLNRQATSPVQQQPQQQQFQSQSQQVPQQPQQRAPGISTGPIAQRSTPVGSSGLNSRSPASSASNTPAQPFIPEVVAIQKPRIENPVKLRQLAPTNPTKYFLSVLGAVLKVPPSEVASFCEDGKDSVDASQTPASAGTGQTSMSPRATTPSFSSNSDEPTAKHRKRGWSGSIAASEFRLAFKDVDVVRGLSEPGGALPTPPQDHEVAKQQQEKLNSTKALEDDAEASEWDYMSLLNA